MKEKALASVVSLFALVAVFKPGKGYTLITNILEVYLSSLFTEKTTERFMDYFRQKIKAYLNYRTTMAQRSSSAFLRPKSMPTATYSAVKSCPTTACWPSYTSSSTYPTCRAAPPFTLPENRPD